MDQGSSAEAVSHVDDELGQLRVALASRTTTAQATGLLAARFGVSTDDAWRLLREVSNMGNVKVRDAARIVVDMHNGASLAGADERRIAHSVARVFDTAVQRTTARWTYPCIEEDHADT